MHPLTPLRSLLVKVMFGYYKNNTMVFAILKWTLISLALIFLVHHLYTFLINTLTVPKIKDLVNKPNEQYKDLFASLHHTGSLQHTGSLHHTGSLQHTSALPAKSMTDELASFLHELKRNGEPEPY